MGRNLATTISRAAALVAVFTGAATLVAMQRAQHHPPPPPPASMQTPPPSPPSPPPPPSPSLHQSSSAHRTPDRGSPRGDAARPGRPARGEGDARRPSESERRADTRTDRVERRPSERQVRRMSAHSRDVPAQPRPLRRLTVPPTPGYWLWRYNKIYKDITTQNGYIPVTPIPSDVSQLTDYAVKKAAGKCAGWKGYGLVVPPKESVTFNLYHPNRSWFRLIICDKWGGTVPGGLGSLMPQPVPRLKYTNPGFETETIYLIVDDPGWMSYEHSPYVLEIARSWNPDLFHEDLGTIVNGIWGNATLVSAEFRRPAMGALWF